ncbi:MAG: type II secretion system protein [Phycisphaerales bacterium]
MATARCGRAAVGGRAWPAIARAFTLVEVLVVLIIIGTVLAILLPSLATTRQAAKKVSSQALMNNLAAATSQFITDRRESPGYFTPVEMGAAANSAPSDSAGSQRGFGAIQNIMIDLAGGITAAPQDGVQLLEVGPTASASVVIDLAQIGGSGAGSGSAASNKAYFTPARQFFEPQGNAQIASDSGNRRNRLLPTLIDAFGQPILAWAQDERGQSVATWAALDSSTVAKYYWAANGCYLNSTALGKAVANQSGDTNYDRPSSLIGGGGTTFDADQVQSSLMALLGHPAFPSPAMQDALGGGFAGSQIPLPGAARGQVVYHSAGANGVYLGTFERGGKAALEDNATRPPAKAARYSGGYDPMLDFDDIVVPAGN